MRKLKDLRSFSLLASRLLSSLSFIGASVLVIAAPRASAQGTPAGPMAPAQPSDQPPPSPKPAPLVGGRPNFAGVWTENKDQSDDPREKMQEAARNSGGGGQGGGRGGWGGGVGGGGGVWGGPAGGGGWGVPAGGGPRGGTRGRGQEQDGVDARMVSEFSRLTIEQTSSRVKVTGESGRVLALCSVAREGESGSGNDSTSDSSSGSSKVNAEAPPAAHWQGNQIVALSQTNGGTTTSTYEMSSDGRQLYVMTKVEGKRLKRPVTFRLVYDPATVSNDGRNQ
jgi:hypothetical protein